MTDFISMEETMGFFVLGPMPPGLSLLNTMDSYIQSQALMEMKVQPKDLRDLLERFSRTFEPDASAPGGGDIRFVSEELIEFFKKRR